MSEQIKPFPPGPAADVTPVPEAMERSTGSKVFLALLGAVSLLYAAVLIYHVSVPPGSANQQAFLEQCRQICMQYGLVSTGNVKHDVRAYLTAVEVKPLSDALDSILADSSFEPAETQQHTLLEHAAPDFELLNETRNSRRLSELLDDGPILLVFYYGFSCSHCVAQLYAIDDDRHYFRELGVQIVCVSQDRPEQTLAAFAEYGKFDFTMLSDPGNLISQKYDCFEPASKQSDGFLKHGTFLLDQQGTVVWANTGFLPFVDNRSLLMHIAKMQNRQPTALATIAAP